jgi:hypothetical protein
MPGMLGDTAAPHIDMAQLPLQAAALIMRLKQQVQSQVTSGQEQRVTFDDLEDGLLRHRGSRGSQKAEAVQFEQVSPPPCDQFRGE